MLARIALSGAVAIAVAGTGLEHGAATPLAARIPGTTSVSPAVQACATEEAKLTASDGSVGDQFGASVSISGDRALVGTKYNPFPPEGVEPGAAYVFVRSGTNWTEETKLNAGDGEDGDYFGISVSLDGDRALVGACGDDDNGIDAGAAYVFVRTETGWAEVTKLTASDGTAGDSFGCAVSLDGDRALVGALTDDGSQFDAGSAYVFVRGETGWTEEAKLTDSNGGQEEYFGASVSLDGDRALVGTFYGSSAYMFVRAGTNWTQEAKLTAGEPGDYFGAAVSLDDDRALVSAFGDDSLSGAAYVFERTGTAWIEEAKLEASDGEFGDAFGYPVSLAGDRAVLGAFFDDVTAFNSGSAYVFVRNGTVWAEEAKLVPGDGGAKSYFGYSVALNGNQALVGAIGDAAQGNSAGAAYVFKLCPLPVTYCTAGTSASGCQATISASGVASATTVSGFDLLISGIEGSKDGLFYFGTHGRQASQWGNGTSYQCVVPPLVRLPIMTGIGTVASCDGWFGLDLNALWCPTCPKPTKNPGAGAVVQAQLWYRDPLSTSNQTTSLSDAIEFVVAP